MDIENINNKNQILVKLIPEILIILIINMLTINILILISILKYLIFKCKNENKNKNHRNVKVNNNKILEDNANLLIANLEKKSLKEKN